MKRRNTIILNFNLPIFYVMRQKRFKQLFKQTKRQYTTTHNDSLTRFQVKSWLILSLKRLRIMILWPSPLTHHNYQFLSLMRWESLTLNSPRRFLCKIPVQSSKLRSIANMALKSFIPRLGSTNATIARINSTGIKRCMVAEYAAVSSAMTVMENSNKWPSQRSRLKEAWARILKISNPRKRRWW